jgi:hypothetical protein
MPLSSLNTSFAALLPVAAIAMSWWSFKWGEAGATPHALPGASPEGREEVMLDRGERYRARLWSKACFNAGALLLVASVPFGQANERAQYLALAGYAIVLFDIFYFVRQVCKIWQHWREDAFDIYFEPIMWQLYDRERTAAIYFRENPMPLWSLFDPDWAAKRKKPNIHEVAEKAPRTKNCTGLPLIHQFAN